MSSNFPTINIDLNKQSTQPSNTPVVKTSKWPSGVFYGTGRRKTSIAKVWIKSGAGEITINNNEMNKFSTREMHHEHILAPLKLTDKLNSFSIKCISFGGGKSGQAGAIRLAISRALLEWNVDLKPKLKSFGLLTRDSRMVERKKYGKHKARKSTQFSKR